jgi:hypothetical protein
MVELMVDWRGESSVDYWAVLTVEVKVEKKVEKTVDE